MFVYLITNAETMKTYVGKTVRSDLGKYLREKIWCAQRGRYRGRSHLFNAMQKYPSTVWSIHPLYEGTSNSDICEHEKKFIKSLGTQDTAIGYNICDGGQGGWSDDVREWVLATIRSPRYRKAQSRRMKKVMNTPEVQLHVSEAQQVRFRDPIKRKEFKEAHNTDKAKKAHSLRTMERLSDPEKKQKWVTASHSGSASEKRSTSLKIWHSDPSTIEDRKLRALRISQAKKAKGVANPHITKLCPVCGVDFTVMYRERNQICCSKGCATSLRMRKVVMSGPATIR